MKSFKKISQAIIASLISMPLFAHPGHEHSHHIGERASHELITFIIPIALLGISFIAYKAFKKKTEN